MGGRILLLAIATLAVLYPAAMRLLAMKVQSMRLKLAAVGDQLLSQPGLSWTQAKFVQALLADAYDWRFMVVMALCLPFFAWNILRGMDSGPFVGLLPSMGQTVKRFMRLHLVSTAAANPFFFAIAILEFLIVALAFYAFNKVRRRRTMSPREAGLAMSETAGIYAELVMGRG